MADPRSLIDTYSVYIDGQWVDRRTAATTTYLRHRGGDRVGARSSQAQVDRDRRGQERLRLRAISQRGPEQRPGSSTSSERRC